jgi:hypothetical protein
MVEQSPSAGETCAPLPRPREPSTRHPRPPWPERPLLAELVVVDPDGTAVGQVDHVTLADGLRAPAHDSNYRAGRINEPYSKPTDHVKDHNVLDRRSRRLAQLAGEGRNAYTVPSVSAPSSVPATVIIAATVPPFVG